MAGARMPSSHARSWFSDPSFDNRARHSGERQKPGAHEVMKETNRAPGPFGQIWVPGGNAHRPRGYDVRLTAPLDNAPLPRSGAHVTPPGTAVDRRTWVGR